jgi:hypothetical protein
MTFLHPLLLWGLPILAAPVLIHLINMLRHRRVQWAAMEFLLLSQKKHRTWIILKQLLLLLLRMAVVAAVVLMVAQPKLRDRWGSLLGTQRTHHIVLLDDSFSMSDHWGDTTALDQAKKAIERIAQAAVRQSQPQSFTLLRFSRAGQYNGGLRADLTKAQVDSEFADHLAATLEKIDPSQTAAEPLPALDAIEQLLGDDDGERRVVYLLTDFRGRQWDNPRELKQHLARLSGNHVELHLIDCVDSWHANLAVTALEPEEGIRAAGVRWRMEVTVQNFGRTPVRNVPVLLTEDGKNRPPVTIAEIPAGATAKEQFYVNFAEAGEHLLSARLEADAVVADNAAYCVVNLAPEMPILLVDGDLGARDVKFLGWALTPGGKVRTGVQPRIETPRFLATHPLDDFRAVTVANVDHLDRSAVEALERYASAGGGVVFFLGEQTRGDFFNRELYRDGKGLFPVPLGGPEDLRIDRLEKTPDMQGDDHFIFRYLGPQRNEHLGAVTVQRYFGVRPGPWPGATGVSPVPGGSTGKMPVAPDGKMPVAPDGKTSVAPRVVMRLRGGAPLLVEKAFGKGRVMAFLSTAAPVWNNWAANNETGSFPVVMRDLYAYLSRRPALAISQQVGQPIQITLDASQYQPQVRFNAPSGDAAASATIDAAPAGPGMLSATFPRADVAGFYEAQLTRTTGKPELRHFAVNVEPGEGDTKALFGQDLASRLSPEVQYHFEQAASFQSNLDDQGGRNLSELLLYVLIILLILEQMLAWSAGYHPVSHPLDHGQALGRTPQTVEGGAV